MEIKEKQNKEKNADHDLNQIEQQLFKELEPERKKLYYYNNNPKNSENSKNSKNELIELENEAGRIERILELDLRTLNQYVNVDNYFLNICTNEIMYGSTDEVSRYQKGEKFKLDFNFILLQIKELRSIINSYLNGLELIVDILQIRSDESSNSNNSNHSKNSKNLNIMELNNSNSSLVMINRKSKYGELIQLYHRTEKKVNTSLERAETYLHSGPWREADDVKKKRKTRFRSTISYWKRYKTES